jgi:hypothetical protein
LLFLRVTTLAKQIGGVAGLDQCGIDEGLMWGD